MARHEDLASFKRFSLAGPDAVVAGGFVLSGGFGSTAAVTFEAGSNDHRGQATITCGGSGHGASPTCTITFLKAFEVAPQMFVQRNGTDQGTVEITVTSTSTTGAVLTFAGTASGTEVYKFRYLVVG
jgi:hypothetical protein